MKSFKDFMTESVRHGINRCTAVTCNAIADHYGTQKLADDHNVKHGTGVIQHLKKSGLKVKGQGWEHEGKTLKNFVKEHPTGVHYIGTRGHAMALVHGKLHDSSNKGVDGRKVELSFEVKKED